MHAYIHTYIHTYIIYTYVHNMNSCSPSGLLGRPASSRGSPPGIIEMMIVILIIAMIVLIIMLIIVIIVIITVVIVINSPRWPPGASQRPTCTM